MRSLVISPFTAERIALVELLRREGHQVAAAADRAEGLALAATNRPDVVIADAQVPRLDGPVLVRELSRHGSLPHVILLCSRASHELDPLPVICLTKPIDVTTLDRLLSQLNSEARSA